MAYATRLHSTVLLLLATMATSAFGQAVEPVRSLAAREKPALLETLKALVSIESASHAAAALGRIANLFADGQRSPCGQARLTAPGTIHTSRDAPPQAARRLRTASPATGAR